MMQYVIGLYKDGHGVIRPSDFLKIRSYSTNPDKFCLDRRLAARCVALCRNPPTTARPSSSFASALWSPH